MWYFHLMHDYLAIKRNKMAIHSSTIAWRIPWTEEPGRLQSMGSQKLDLTEQFTHTQRLKVSVTLDIFSMFSNFALSIFDYLQENQQISEASFSLISTRLYFLLSNISICLFASLSAKPEPKTRVYCVFLLASPL